MNHSHGHSRPPAASMTHLTSLNTKWLRIPLTALTLLLAFQPTAIFAAEEAYTWSADSNPREGVPQGKVTQHEFSNSKVFEGTRRRYSVYVPAQYDGSKPAALMVFQDGHTFQGPGGDFRLPTVFDNLIAAGDMPVTIAVMVDPGHKGELPPKRGWNPTPSNRAFEYDSVTGDYAEFLLTELLPEVEKQYKIT
ncbi:alpha/beta hydrolase, partial [Rhodopirellula bahusiensis]